MVPTSSYPAGGRRGRGERGQALPLLVVVVAVAVGAASAVALLGARAGRLARAQTSADAVALAGVGDSTAIGAVSRANGVRVVEIERGDGKLRVDIDLDGERASATAVRPRSEHHGLQPVMVAAIRTAEALLGEPVPIASGFRTAAEQRWLWEHRHENKYPVAPPGTSRHEVGLAIDVPWWFVGRLALVGPRAGLCQPLPLRDRVHFELCPGTLTP